MSPSFYLSIYLSSRLYFPKAWITKQFVVRPIEKAFSLCPTVVCGYFSAWPGFRRSSNFLHKRKKFSVQKCGAHKFKMKFPGRQKGRKIVCVKMPIWWIIKMTRANISWDELKSNSAIRKKCFTDLDVVYFYHNPEIHTCPYSMQQMCYRVRRFSKEKAIRKMNPFLSLSFSRSVCVHRKVH